MTEWAGTVSGQVDLGSAPFNWPVLQMLERLGRLGLVGLVGLVGLRPKCREPVCVCFTNPAIDPAGWGTLARAVTLYGAILPLTRVRSY